MFKREHHLRVATILQALDGELLAKHHCLFGGGTAIVLLRGEYRESLDIDFLVSDHDGYRAIRQLLTGPQGIRAITRAGMEIELAREIRADRDGIRTMAKVLDTEIKLEIVLEARVALTASGPSDQVCGVAPLAPIDMATTKLLANSDRWADDAVFSRDLIDLGMLDLPAPSLKLAKEKAAGAYGASVEQDLEKAIRALGTRKGRLEECMEALRMGDVPRAVVWQRIRDLKKTGRG